MKRLITIVGIAFTLLGCGGGTTATQISNENNVTVSACQSDVNFRTTELDNTISDNNTYIEYRYANNTLWLTHYNAVFNCDGSGIDATASIDGNQITITEEQDLASGEGAKCLCLYDITIELNDIEAQNYTIVYDDGLSDDINFDIYLHLAPNGVKSFARNAYPYSDIEDSISKVALYRTGNLQDFKTKLLRSQAELDEEISNLTQMNISNSMDGDPPLTTILQNSTIDFSQKSLLIFAFTQSSLCDYNENILLSSPTEVNITLSTPSATTPCEEVSVDYYLAYSIDKEIEVVNFKGFTIYNNSIPINSLIPKTLADRNTTTPQGCDQDITLTQKSSPSSIVNYSSSINSFNVRSAFNYDERGNLIQEINYFHKYTLTQTFDENSHLLSKLIDYENETLSTTDPSQAYLRNSDEVGAVFIVDQFYSYTYNEEGQILTESYDQGNDGKVDQITIYRYDSMGNLEYKKVSNGSYTVAHAYTYTYDDQGELATEELIHTMPAYESDKDYDYNMTYSYDDQGNVIQKYQIYTTGVLNNRIYRYTYNENAKLLSEKVYEITQSDEELVDFEINTYDERGNLLSRKEGSSGNIYSYRLYEYTYDENNNIVTYSIDNSLYEYRVYDAYSNLLKLFAYYSVSYTIDCYRYEE